MDTATYLPPGFERRGARIVQVDTDSRFLPVWIETVLTDSLEGYYSVSTERKIRETVNANGIAYVTGAMGRVGWNVRSSFPKDWAHKRKLPFVVARRDGEEIRVTRYHSARASIST